MPQLPDIQDNTDLNDGFFILGGLIIEPREPPLDGGMFPFTALVSRRVRKEQEADAVRNGARVAVERAFYFLTRHGNALHPREKMRK